MSTIFTLFMVLIMIACVLLVIIIMAQNPKGGGLSGTFGGTSSATFGVQRTNDFMEKATWTLGITIAVLILLSIVMTGKPSVATQAPKAPAKQEAPVAPTNNAPATQAPVQK
ncbi:preprotein translocase subunit SecG [Chryseobacterium sp. T1]